MNQPTNESPVPELEVLRSRVQALQRAVSSAIQKSERRRKAYLLVGGLLAFACFTSFSILTSRTFQLDAEAITQIGRQQVEMHLPEGRESMVTYLKEKAPEFTSYLLNAITGSIPHVRPLVLRELDDKIQIITSQFEVEMIAQMEDSIKASREDLESKFPGRTDVEKIEEVVSVTADKFNENTKALLHALYPKFSAEMDYVKSYLVALRDKDPAKLTPREKMEKELIQTLLRLIARENHDQLLGR